MACDAYTKRPRTPNDQYTVMTDQQIRNVTRNAKPFFSFEGNPKFRESQGHHSYSRQHSVSLVRDLEQSHDAMYVEDQKPQVQEQTHDISLDGAAVKWGPMKLGERTRSHFFGEQIEGFLKTDADRRPATSYTGRVMMEFGHPADGYYTQHYPNRASWNNSTAPLNNKNVLTNIYHKTTWEHIEVLKTEKMARLARRDDWPEYSTYTAGYLLKENIPEGMTSDTVLNFEKQKMHAAKGQRLQAEEREKANRTRPLILPEQEGLDALAHQNVIVCATPTTS